MCAIVVMKSNLSVLGHLMLARGVLGVSQLIVLSVSQLLLVFRTLGTPDS